MNSKGHPRYQVRFYSVAQVYPTRNTKAHVNLQEDYALKQKSLKETAVYFSKSN